jgi:hypothetical protein
MRCCLFIVSGTQGYAKANGDGHNTGHVQYASQLFALSRRRLFLDVPLQQRPELYKNVELICAARRASRVSSKWNCLAVVVPSPVMQEKMCVAA